MPFRQPISDDISAGFNRIEYPGFKVTLFLLLLKYHLTKKNFLNSLRKDKCLLGCSLQVLRQIQKDVSFGIKDYLLFLC
jgi:hypothetical protein